MRRFDSISITGIDNLNDYYDVSIKEWRLKQIEEEVSKHAGSSFCFVKGSIADKALVDKLFAENDFDIVEILLHRPE